MSTRPDIVDDDHLEFLDELRASSETNMYGAGPYIQREFGETRKDAQTIVLYWMHSFKERQARIAE